MQIYLQEHLHMLRVCFPLARMRFAGLLVVVKIGKVLHPGQPVSKMMVHYKVPWCIGRSFARFCSWQAVPCGLAHHAFCSKLPCPSPVYWQCLLKSRVQHAQKQVLIHTQLLATPHGNVGCRNPADEPQSYKLLRSAKACALLVLSQFCHFPWCTCCADPHITVRVRYNGATKPSCILQSYVTCVCCPRSSNSWDINWQGKGLMPGALRDVFLPCLTWSMVCRNLKHNLMLHRVYRHPQPRHTSAGAATGSGWQPWSLS